MEIVIMVVLSFIVGLAPFLIYNHIENIKFKRQSKEIYERNKMVLEDIEKEFQWNLWYMKLSDEEKVGVYKPFFRTHL